MKTKTMSVLFVVSFVVLATLLMGCTTTSMVYVPAPTQEVVVQQPQVVYQNGYGYGYGNGAGRVRVSTGRFLGIFPFTSTSTSWSAHYVEPVYVAPPVDIYYSYPSFSAGFEWRNGRLDRHRTWGPSRQSDCRPNHHRGGHGRR